MRFSVEVFVFEPKNSTFNLLVVPLLKGNAIDWEFINKINTFGAIDVKEVSAKDRLKYCFEEQTFKDCIFYPWYRKDQSIDQNGRPFVYYSLKVSDLNSRSQFMNSRRDGPTFNTFDEYFSTKYNIDIKNKDLPLIEGRAINKGAKGLFKGAQLKPYLTNKKDNRYPEYYPPELVCIHPFPASLWRQALCLPAVLYRLNHLYLSEELRQKIHLETIPKIGSLKLEDNCLKLKFECNFSGEPLLEPESDHQNNSAKRMYDAMDSDDECEGHEYTDESYMEIDFHRISFKKKQRKQSQITIEKSKTPPIVRTDTLNFNTVPTPSNGSDPPSKSCALHQRNDQ